MQEKISILGVEVSVVNEKTVIEKILAQLEQKGQIQIVTPNPEHIIQAQSDSEFRKILNEASVAIPDGIGLVWALNRAINNQQSTIKSVSKVTGVDLMMELIRLATERNWQVGLLGALEEVGQEAVKKLVKHFPKMAGSIFYIGGHKNITRVSEEEDQALVGVIEQRGTDLLFVAYGAPYQEKWIASHLSELQQVKIAMGVGGSFDYLSGKVTRAPIWLRKLGLEWLFRLVKEPWRIRRQMRLIEFGWRVLTSN